MRIRYGVAATLALVVVLALGSTGTSAAPAVATAASDNAVVHWSGVAATAISVGRAPASSSVLGGMVHGAMYDAVAAVEGGLEPFATDVTAAPGASADAAVAQARATSSSSVFRARRLPSRRRTTPTWVDSGRVCEGAGKAAAPPPRPECSRCGAATTSTTSCRTSSRRPAPACSSRSRRLRRSTRSSPSCGRSRTPRRRSTGRGPTRSRPGATRRTWRNCRRTGASTAPSGRRSDRDRPLPHGADLLPVQPDAARPRERPRSRPAGVGAAAGVRARCDGGHDDRLLGGEVPLQLLASEPRDPACGHGREPGDVARSHLAAAGRRQPPGVPVRPLLLHRCRDRVAPELLRDEARAARDLEHRGRRRPAADVRGPGRARGRRRERPRLGRPPLPHHDDRDGQALPADRARHRQADTSWTGSNTTR